MWRQQRRQQNFGVMLLLMQMMNIGFDHIPPVTLATIALNASIYLGLLQHVLNQRVPDVDEICVGVMQVWPTQDYWRIIAATFYHADDMHLYYNMISFLWKGRSLERVMGSKHFLYMLGVFSILVNVVLLYINYAAARVFQDPNYYRQCAVGFSGVVFAVKVVTTEMMPQGNTYLMGIPINPKFSCWAELILIQVLVPNASFTGHLAGILVGLAYVKSPLRYLMYLPFPRSAGYRSGPSYTYMTGRASSTSRVEHNSLNQYESYTGGYDEDQQVDIALRESLKEQQPSTRLYPNLANQRVASIDQPASSQAQPPPYGWNIPPPNHQNFAPSNPNDQSDKNEMRRRWVEYSNQH